MKFNASVGCKAEGKSTAVIGLFIAADSRRYVYTRVRKCRRFDQLGMPSESSHIATG